MATLPGYARKLALLGAVVAAGWTWADTFKTSIATSDWTGGFWGTKRQTAGNVVYTGGREVETPEERVKREKREMAGTGLGAVVKGVKREVLGDRDGLRGEGVRAQRADMPWTYENLPPREVCLQQKMEFPDRFGHLDCMAPEYDSAPRETPRQPGLFDDLDAGAGAP